MLSRVKSLAGLAVLGSFSANILEQRLQEEFRAEFHRLEVLDSSTLAWFKTRNNV